MSFDKRFKSRGVVLLSNHDHYLDWESLITVRIWVFHLLGGVFYISYTIAPI